MQKQTKNNYTSICSYLTIVRTAIFFFIIKSGFIFRGGSKLVTNYIIAYLNDKGAE